MSSKSCTDMHAKGSSRNKKPFLAADAGPCEMESARMLSISPGLRPAVSKVLSTTLTGATSQDRTSMKKISYLKVTVQ